MNEKKISQLYNLIINNGIILKKENLLNIFTEEEIQNLIKNKILESTNKDEYILKNIDSLHHYGIKLINKNNYEAAITCFKRCIEYDPYKRNSYLQIIYLQIKTKKISETFEIFKELDKIKPEIYEKDNNFLLYQLSLISNYPEEYKNRVYNMGTNEILKISDNPNDEILRIQNQIKNKIIQKKLHIAKDLLKNLPKKDNSNKIEFILMETLLDKEIEINKKRMDYLLYLSKDKDYKQIISILETRHQKIKLDLHESYVYYLAKHIEWIKEKRKIPKITIIETNNFKEAIKGNNFSLALNLNSIYLKDQGYRKDSNILHILLLDINKLIKEVIEERKELNKVEQTSPQTNKLTKKLTK